MTSPYGFLRPATPVSPRGLQLRTPPGFEGALGRQHPSVGSKDDGLSTTAPESRMTTEPETAIHSGSTDTPSEDTSTLFRRGGAPRAAELATPVSCGTEVHGLSTTAPESKMTTEPETATHPESHDYPEENTSTLFRRGGAPRAAGLAAPASYGTEVHGLSTTATESKTTTEPETATHHESHNHLEEDTSALLRRGGAPQATELATPAGTTYTGARPDDHSSPMMSTAQLDHPTFDGSERAAPSTTAPESKLTTEPEMAITSTSYGLPPVLSGTGRFMRVPPAGPSATSRHTSTAGARRQATVTPDTTRGGYKPMTTSAHMLRGTGQAVTPNRAAHAPASGPPTASTLAATSARASSSRPTPPSSAPATSHAVHGSGNASSKPPTTASMPTTLTGTATPPTHTPRGGLESRRLPAITQAGQPVRRSTRLQGRCNKRVALLQNPEVELDWDLDQPIDPGTDPGHDTSWPLLDRQRGPPPPGPLQELRQHLNESDVDAHLRARPTQHVLTEDVTFSAAGGDGPIHLAAFWADTGAGPTIINQHVVDANGWLTETTAQYLVFANGRRSGPVERLVDGLTLTFNNEWDVNTRTYVNEATDHDGLLGNRTGHVLSLFVVPLTQRMYLFPRLLEGDRYTMTSIRVETRVPRMDEPVGVVYEDTPITHAGSQFYYAAMSQLGIQDYPLDDPHVPQDDYVYTITCEESILPDTSAPRDSLPFDHGCQSTQTSHHHTCSSIQDGNNHGDADTGLPTGQDVNGDNHCPHTSSHDTADTTRTSGACQCATEEGTNREATLSQRPERQQATCTEAYHAQGSRPGRTRPSKASFLKQPRTDVGRDHQKAAIPAVAQHDPTRQPRSSSAWLPDPVPRPSQTTLL